MSIRSDFMAVGNLASVHEIHFMSDSLERNGPVSVTQSFHILRTVDSLMRDFLVKQIDLKCSSYGIQATLVPTSLQLLYLSSHGGMYQILTPNLPTIFDHYFVIYAIVSHARILARRISWPLRS